MAYKTKDELLAEVASELASAKPGKILASDLRSVLDDILDSYIHKGDEKKENTVGSILYLYNNFH